MNPFKDFTENECIYCETQEEWNAIIAMNPSNNVLCNGERLVYYPALYCFKGGWDYYVNIKNNENLTIHQASEFLKPKFEHLEEIEVSDNGINFSYNEEKYIGNTSNGKIVTENKFGQITFWNYARKINKERTEAINQIKETMQKFNIKKEEL